MGVVLKNLKGTADYLPEEQAARQKVRSMLEEVFAKYGYPPLETPIICLYDILASKYGGGAEILKEVYRLSDQGGRELALRYDLTTPFARVVGMNPELRLPFKRYEIGKVFRDGPVKTGRNREFVQCDVDVVGTTSLLAEAEQMAMTAEVFDNLGLDVVIEYNNRKLLCGLITACGIPAELVEATVLTVDKLEKVGAAAVTESIETLGVAAPQAKKLFSYLNCPPDRLVATAAELVGPAAEGAADIALLAEYLEAAGLSSLTRFTPWLARGLAIYTGTVWEVFLRDGSITSSLAAGGRYDRIIGAFLDNGQQYPAVGMSFGLDVICAALRATGAAEKTARADFYLIPLATEPQVAALANKLRRIGARVEIEMMGRRLKKALEYANRENIPFALILGDEEVNAGQATLRNMVEGTERRIGLAELEELAAAYSQVRLQRV